MADNPEIFGPDESTGVEALVADPWKDTSGGASLNDWLFGTSEEWNQLLSQPFNVGVWVQVIVEWLKDFIGWLKGQFEGVPKSAKTVGSGIDLMRAHDPVAQYIGAQLVAGGYHNHVLSEGGWPQNFPGRIIAHGGALIELANLQPPSAYWKVRATPAIGRQRGAPALEYKAGPLPPPANAPYDNSVVIQGFYAPAALDPVAFQNQWGVPPPTGQQLRDFLLSDHAITFNAMLANISTLAKMRDSFRDLWISGWKAYLSDISRPPPVGPPPPPVGKCKDPCQQEVIDQLYSIAVQMYENQAGSTALEANLPLILKALENLSGDGSSSAIVVQLEAIAQGIKAADAPLMAILENLPILIQALRSLSDPGIAKVLQDLVDCVCPALDTVSGWTLDLKELNEWAKVSREHIHTPKELIDSWVALGSISPETAQILQSGSFPWDMTDALHKIAAFLGGLEGDIEHGLGKLVVNLLEPVAKVVGQTVFELENFINALPGEAWNWLKEGWRKFIAQVRADAGPNSSNLRLIGFFLLDGLKLITEQGFGGLAEWMLGLVVDPLLEGGYVTADNFGVRAQIAYGDALTAGLAAEMITTVIDLIAITKQTGLVQLGHVLEGLSGVEEVSKAQLAPVLHAAVATPAQYFAQFKTRPFLPDQGTALGLLARRLITDDRASALLAYAGLNPDYVAPVKAAAFSPLSARLLASAYNDTDFDTAPLVEVLRFSGHREADINVAIDAYRAAALKSRRQGVVGAAQANFVAGLSSDAEFTETLEGLGISDEAQDLILQAALERRLQVMTEEYRKGWDARFMAREIDEADYRLALSGLGYESPVLDGIVGGMSGKLDAQEFKQEGADAKAARRKEQELAIQAAMTSFKANQIDLPALTAALIVAGLDLTQVALYTALAAARGQTAAAKKKAARSEEARLAIRAGTEEYMKGEIDANQLRVKLSAAGMTHAAIDAEIEYLNARGAKGQ